MQAKWNATEEKPAVIAIGLSSFVAIWAASGLVDAINRLPLINGVLEGVGLVVTGWFVYRNLIFGPDRCATFPTHKVCLKASEKSPQSISYMLSSRTLQQFGLKSSERRQCEGDGIYVYHWSGVFEGSQRSVQFPCYRYAELTCDQSLYREELRKNIDDFLKKVTGKMDASVSKASSSVKDTLNK